MSDSQLQLQYASKTDKFSNSFSSDSFSLVSVYDRHEGGSVKAYCYSYYLNNTNTRINVNIVPEVNSLFVAAGCIYFDTVYHGDALTEAIRGMGVSSTSTIIDINCYINMPSSTIIKSVNKTFKTIVSNYVIKEDIFRKPPTASLSDWAWLSYDPSANMYSVSIAFVLEQEFDYSDVSECYYRTSFFGNVGSLKYPYANSAITDVCSNSHLMQEAQKKRAVCSCPYSRPDDIVKCSYYKEDKFKLFTLELFLQNDSQRSLPAIVIDAYLSRTVKDNDYSIIFMKKDYQEQNAEQVLLKRLLYKNVDFKGSEKQDELIKEARLQLFVILSDYVSDFKDSNLSSAYTYKVVDHISSMTDLIEVPKVKESYIAKLADC